MLTVGVSEDVSGENNVDCWYKGGYGGLYTDVAYDGNYLYATHVQGLSIFDVSNASNPVMIGFIQTNGSADNVVVSGNYAYVADWENGLVIVNISDPTDPTEEGHYDTVSARGVAVSGGYAYVADGDFYDDSWHYGAGLVIVNISDPTDPKEEGHYNTADSARGVAVSGGYAYVADYTNGLVIMNISDPTDPKEEGHYDTEDYALSVAVSGGYAYVADYRNGLVTVNISDKTNPTEAGHCGTHAALDVVMSGDYAYVADRENGFLIVNASDPSNITEVGHQDTEGLAYGVAMNGDYAYVADEKNGVVIMNVSDPENPTLESHLATVRGGAAVRGNYVYSASWHNGLVIVNVSDPENPILEGDYNTAGIARCAVVSGDYAYVADWTNGLVIVNVSDPENPTLEGQVSTSDNARGVAVKGNYAYVATRSRGLDVVDISDPMNPTVVGNDDTDGESYTVVVSGDYAYIADGSNGLVIMNVNNPKNPIEVGHYDIDGAAEAVRLYRDYAYVDGVNGFDIVNISDPTNPIREGRQMTTGKGGGVTIRGNHAFIGDNDNGVVIMDVSDPVDPIEVGNYDTYGSAGGVAVRGNYAYINDGDNGLVIIEMNFPPIAFIDSLLLNPALDTDDVEFKGHGTDDRTIERYFWTSSLDGVIHNSTTNSNFSSSTLTLGEHTISFQVQDDHGVWSDEVTETLVVTEKPEAFIDSISPNPALETDGVEFKGHGTDDGNISLYVWYSDIDGELYNGTSTHFTSSSLHLGNHNITLRVQDNDGIWSDQVNETLIIHERPVASIVSISLNPALDTDVVEFKGHGTDDGNISLYVWHSNLDGELYNGTSANFTSSSLHLGNHTITLRVQDDHGVWSDNVSKTLIVTEKPEAFIDSISPNPALEKEDVEFEGHGTDDGNISLFVWYSDIDGELYNGTSCNFTCSNLSLGVHNITLKVQENYGVWCDQVNETLIIHERPVASIDSISPNPAFDTDDVVFEGHGTDDGNINRYVWRSDIDGELYNGTNNNFTSSSLFLGIHNITLSVQDNYGVWSNTITTDLIVDHSPTDCYISADDISFSTVNPRSDETVIIYARVHNFGKTEATGTVNFYAKDKLIGTDSVTIQSQDTDVAFIDWTPKSDGDYIIGIEIVNCIPEEDTETDNKAQKTVTVGSMIKPNLVITLGISNIATTEGGIERTIPVKVYCYNEPVYNVHLVIIDDANVSIEIMSPNQDLDPNDVVDFIIKIKTPKLKGNDTILGKKVLICAKGEINNETTESNTEQLDIIIHIPVDDDGFIEIPADALISAGIISTILTCFRTNKNRSRKIKNIRPPPTALKIEK